MEPVVNPEAMTDLKTTFAVYLSTSLLEQARVEAQARRLSVSALMVQALEGFLGGAPVSTAPKVKAPPAAKKASPKKAGAKRKTITCSHPEVAKKGVWCRECGQEAWSVRGVRL